MLDCGFPLALSHKFEAKARRPAILSFPFSFWLLDLGHCSSGASATRHALLILFFFFSSFRCWWLVPTSSACEVRRTFNFILQSSAGISSQLAKISSFARLSDSLGIRKHGRYTPRTTSCSVCARSRPPADARPQGRQGDSHREHCRDGKSVMPVGICAAEVWEILEFEIHWTSSANKRGARMEGAW